MLHIVLHEPEMPANTGNIGRTCVACGAVLHLIEPLGFRLNEKMIKRAGLDYWDKLDVRTYINFEDFLEKNNDPKIYMATTKAKHVYSAPAYEDDEDVYIMFGKESAGIPEEILLNYEETSIRIPMLPHIRSLNFRWKDSCITINGRMIIEGTANGSCSSFFNIIIFKWQIF